MTARIVIVGSGGAGLVAAIAARRPGNEVIVVSKTARGTGTSTAYSAGIFTLGCGRVAPEMHLAKTLEVGQHVNDLPLLQTFSENARKSLEQLKEWGISLKFMESGHASVRASAPNPFMGGYGMIEELYRIAGDMGVKFLENNVVTDIRIERNKVVGIECVNWKTGKADGFGASAIILATGGAGQIYGRTDNPGRITGDGYSLALRAGASLRDMEFVQFYPLGWDEPGFTDWMIDLAMIDKVPLLDEKGDEFLLRAIHSWGLENGAEANYYARDKASIHMARHLKGGGKAILHLEKLSSEEWDDRENLIEMRNFYPQDMKPWEYGPVGVSPIEHYMTGGVVIDTSCRTGIEGLYACGEVAGGVDGASRIGGNALSNIVTFGLIAGKTASESAGETAADFTPLKSERMVKSWSEGTESPENFSTDLREIMLREAGLIRNASSLERAIEKLNGFRARYGNLRVTDHFGLLHALETVGLLDSAMSVAKAALAREESRGVHFREDYPTLRKEWRKTVFVSLDSEGEIGTGENG